MNEPITTSELETLLHRAGEQWPRIQTHFRNLVRDLRAHCNIRMRGLKVLEAPAQSDEFEITLLGRNFNLKLRPAFHDNRITGIIELYELQRGDPEVLATFYLGANGDVARRPGQAVFNMDDIDPPHLLLFLQPIHEAFLLEDTSA